MDRPNILLVVWDACRFDYVVNHASFLNELGSSNLWFENAIAPSPWSLPSHASLFTGKYPHEHNRNRYDDPLDTPLVEELSRSGYTTYGVSANGFASQRTGFHEDFDEFRYTGGRDAYVDGLDVSGNAHDILRDDDRSYRDVAAQVLKQIPRHDHPIKSLTNLAAVGCGELATKVKQLQNIPHPVFAPTSDYSYTPEKNTRKIRSVVRNHDDSDPFFLFTNYMDTHRCYKATPELQEKHLGRTLGYDELVRLNEEVAAPWEFETKKALGQLDQEDTETIRALYAAEVEAADRHLRQIHQMLAEEDLLDETLIIVTSDHGENLGETDEMGRQRMGHESSVSDAVLQVPLVLAHPDLDHDKIRTEVSIESLYDLCLAVADDSVPNDNSLLTLLTDTLAVSQYPATGSKGTLDTYPDVPAEIVKHRSSEDQAVTYGEGWKIVAESSGTRWAGDENGAQEFPTAPTRLTELSEAHLQKLQEADVDDELAEEDIEQLEALGYM